MTEVPKTLVFGQPFNDLSGGGITISNLFKGWPKEKMAATFVVWGNTIYNTEICNNNYLIGRAEHKWRFPLNYFKKPFPESGTFSNHVEGEKTANNSKPTLRGYLSEAINPVLHWMGIYHYATKIFISDRQKAWLKEFKPEILYL